MSYKDVIGTGIVPYRRIDVDARIALDAIVTAGGTVTDTIREATHTLFTSLKTNSLYTLAEAMYLMVGGTSGAHAVNAKNPGTFNLTFNGGWTHGSNGINGDAVNGTYAATGYVPSTQHSDGLMSMGLYSRTNAASATVCDMGAYNAAGTKQLAMWLEFVSNFYGLANCVGVGSLVANTDSSGWFFVSRTGASVNFLQRNSTQNSFTESVATPTVEVYIGARNSDGTNGFWSSKQFAFAWLGAALTTGQASTLYTIIQAFQTTLGRNV